MSEEEEEGEVKKTTQIKKAVNVGLDACGAEAKRCLQKVKKLQICGGLLKVCVYTV